MLFIKIYAVSFDSQLVVCAGGQIVIFYSILFFSILRQLLF
jgi:hypothetical protein